LDKALHLATSGRPGPCWLDIPVDVQSALVNPDELAKYSPESDPLPYDVTQLPAACASIMDRIQNAKRPVLLVGSGVRLAGAIDTLENRVIAHIPIGQTAQALVYVPNAVPEGSGTQNLLPLGEAANTAKLLLASATEKHPNGLANGSDLVGRNVTFHEYSAAVGTFEDPIYAWAGGGYVSASSFEFNGHDDSRGFAGGGHIACAGVGIPLPISFSLPDKPTWGQAAKDADREFFNHTMAVGLVLMRRMVRARSRRRITRRRAAALVRPWAARHHHAAGRGNGSTGSSSQYESATSRC
jgi:hypothetical protein